MYAVIQLGGECIATGESAEDAIYTAERNLDASEGELDYLLCKDQVEYCDGAKLLITDESPLWEVYSCE